MCMNKDQTNFLKFFFYLVASDGLYFTSNTLQSLLITFAQWTHIVVNMWYIRSLALQYIRTGSTQSTDFHLRRIPIWINNSFFISELIILSLIEIRTHDLRGTSLMHCQLSCLDWIPNKTLLELCESQPRILLTRE